MNHELKVHDLYRKTSGPKKTNNPMPNKLQDDFLYTGNTGICMYYNVAQRPLKSNNVQRTDR